MKISDELQLAMRSFMKQWREQWLLDKKRLELATPPPTPDLVPLAQMFLAQKRAGGDAEEKQDRQLVALNEQLQGIHLATLTNQLHEAQAAANGKSDILGVLRQLVEAVAQMATALQTPPMAPIVTVSTVELAEVMRDAIRALADRPAPVVHVAASEMPSPAPVNVDMKCVAEALASLGRLLATQKPPVVNVPAADPPIVQVHAPKPKRTIKTPKHGRDGRIERVVEEHEYED